MGYTNKVGIIQTTCEIKIIIIITKQKLLLTEDLRSARCSPFFSKVLAARKTNLITAQARNNNRNTHMVANGRRDEGLTLETSELQSDGGQFPYQLW